MLISRCLRAGVVAVVALPGFGCGPSFEAIQEGDLRFAHCDRLDIDRQIAPSHRMHCWREWRRVYSYGQTRDRVEYAQRRIAELSSGDRDSPVQLQPTLGVQKRALTRARADSSRESGGEEKPGSCQEQCAGALEKCREQCVTHPHGCERCEPEKNACMERCG